MLRPLAGLRGCWCLPNYKRHLKSQIEAIAASKKQLKNQLAAVKPIKAESQSLYYSAWYWSAVHILTGVPGFQGMEKIAARMELPLNLVRMVLEHLEKAGVVRREGQNWLLQDQDLHLPDDALGILPYHQSWRQKAMLHKPLNRDSDFFYSSVQSVAKKDVDLLRATVLASVQKLRQAVRESPRDEEVVCFNCDFFLL